MSREKKRGDSYVHYGVASSVQQCVLLVCRANDYVFVVSFDKGTWSRHSREAKEIYVLGVSRSCLASQRRVM